MVYQTGPSIFPKRTLLPQPVKYVLFTIILRRAFHVGIGGMGWWLRVMDHSPIPYGNRTRKYFTMWRCPIFSPGVFYFIKTRLETLGWLGGLFLLEKNGWSFVVFTSATSMFCLSSIYTYIYIYINIYIYMNYETHGWKIVIFTSRIC